jgi:hypothetical protein
VNDQFTSDRAINASDEGEDTSTSAVGVFRDIRAELPPSQVATDRNGCLDVTAGAIEGYSDLIALSFRSQVREPLADLLWSLCIDWTC